jgi:hypothetical protein
LTQRKDCGAITGYHIKMVSPGVPMNVALSVFLVFATFFAIPMVVYGILAAPMGMKVPGEDPLAFLAGVAVSKFGTAIAFVGLWLMVRYDHADRIWTYVLIWWLMFVLGEIGQTIGPDYSWKEALAGIISESIYLPLAGLIVARLLRD